MAIFLDRIDSVPLQGEDFTFEFNSWVAVLVDTLNENLSDIQNALNLFSAPSYTATEINDMLVAGTLANGILLYDTTNNVYVGMQSGSLVKFTTTAYP
jgi:hypothetical protein